MRKEIAIGVGLVLLALWVGSATDNYGWSLLLATWCWVGLQFRAYRHVAKWSQQPISRPLNGPPHWFKLAYTPYRALLRQRLRTRNMAARMRQIISLTEVIPDGVIVLNAAHEIEGFNSAAKALLKLSDADVGLSFASIVRVPELIAHLREEQSQSQPLEFSLPQQAEITLEARQIRVDEERIILLVRNITTLNRLLTMRQNFVANVSHELRTPLTVVNGYLESLEDPQLEDAVKLQLIPRLAAPMQRMQSLVEDLLLLTQLESTPDEAHKEPVNLGAVIERAGAELEPLTTSAGQLRFKIQSSAKVLGFETELHSVCVNLISNAIRYSPDGNPIEIEYSDVEDGVRLLVRDSGNGIAPEHLSRLTERFYRVDMSGARARGGTGLGLAIVKHVLRRHGSELHIDSELGVGSVFWCVLEPLQQASAEQQGSAQDATTSQAEALSATPDA